MINTQQEIPISDIGNDIVTLKSGDMALVLQTSAVNFGLLSENEQVAIIGAFAGLLNSLSFSIQILIRSKRLDISNYLKKLDAAQHLQTNQLLFQLMGRYRTFIERTIRENEVLDKQFYVIVPLWYYEIGVLKNTPDKMKKVLATLLPRKDHLVRQLAGIGLQAKQLNNEELTKLFYDIYNTPNEEEPNQVVKAQAPHEAVVEAGHQTEAGSSSQPVSIAQLPQQPAPSPSQFHYPPNLPQPAHLPVQGAVQNQLHPQTAMNPRTPFVVEELPDDYGTV